MANEETRAAAARIAGQWRARLGASAEAERLLALGLERIIERHGVETLTDALVEASGVVCLEAEAEARKAVPS